MTDHDPGGIFHELAQPTAFKWRLKSVANKATKPYPPGTKGQFLAYIDARDVFNKLDGVVGAANWQSEVRAVNGDGSVIVRLSIRVNNEWIIREDIGYSNNPNSDKEEEPLKAAVSDAVKRAAVHYGIGRFLYEMPAKWVEINQYGDPVRPLPGAPTDTRDANLRSMAGSLATIARNSDMPPDEAVNLLADTLGVDRSTGEITSAPPAPRTSHPGAEQAASGESPRDGAARTLWNEAKAKGFDKKTLDLFCIDRTNHTLDKADTQALIKCRSELKFVEDIPALIDFLTNRPERHVAPAQPTTPNPETTDDQPCAIDGCAGSCKGDFINFSLRRYGVVLCAKHSKMAKDGALESELQALNSVAAR